MQKRLLLIVSAVALIAGVGALVYFSAAPIKSYKASRDRAFIIDFFKNNWYWLLSDYSPDYDVEFMLDYRAPTTKTKKDVGRLIIYTYVVDGKPVGFIHFYEKKLKVGQILFLGVDEAHRGKGYARQLMKFAIKDLKNRGMLAIRMNTRTDNVKGRKLYDSLGFKQVWTDGAYIIYELIP